jgi:hypothetical protein
VNPFILFFTIIGILTIAVLAIFGLAVLISSLEAW